MTLHDEFIRLFLDHGLDVAIDEFCRMIDAQERQLRLSDQRIVELENEIERLHMLHLARQTGPDPIIIWTN